MSTRAALGVGLTTVRPDEASAFLLAVLRQHVHPACISVCHQGPADRGQALERDLTAIAHDHGYSGLRYVSMTERGASQGRNVAIRAIPENVSWVWTPNDTSRPPHDWATIVGDHLEALDQTVAAVAMDYFVSGALRRCVSDVSELTGWSLWRAIEPALIWNRRYLLDAGGFDERIGTGVSSWAQSGECTDLLCRLRDAGRTVATLPVAIQGQPQHLDPRALSSVRKEFYYGVGFGLVARRHFPLARSLGAVVSPLVKLLTSRKVEGVRLGARLSLTAAAGRGVGLLLGETSLRLRIRARHWA